MRRKVRRGRVLARGRRRTMRIRAPKLDPEAIGRSVADALAPMVERYAQLLAPDALSRVISQAVQPLADKVADKSFASVATAPAPEQVAFLSSEQRHTKPLAPYESFVYGFGLSVPVKMEPGDAIDRQETREKFRERYQTIVNFLMEMMREVEAEIDAARGVIR